MWSGVRDRWASNPTAPDPDRWMPEEPVEFDRAEPTDGRHAFDRDAALTPIFTSLRRTSAPRPRGRTGGAPLRVVPEHVERFRDDPPTAPIPIVPALHAVDPYESGGYEPYPPVDPYRSGGYRRRPRRPVLPGVVRAAAGAGRAAAESGRDDGGVAPHRRPGVLRPGDLPAGVLRPGVSGDRHRPPPPPPGARRLVTRESARSSARVRGLVRASRYTLARECAISNVAPRWARAALRPRAA